MSELQMQNLVAALLMKLGYDVYTEVPFLNRSIDIVASMDGEICSFELKLSDWRKAVTQSKDHLHGVDKAYVCMPLMTRLNDDFLSLLQDDGIGLMLYDPDKGIIEEVLPAQKTEIVWQPAHQWLRGALQIA